MKSFLASALLASLAAITGCEIGRPVYRATAKLLVTTAGPALPVSDLVGEDSDTFFETQMEIMRSQTMLRRVQQRMRKTPDEIRENLTHLKIARVTNADIILISVDSPSADFARDFANALMEEYLRFRDEQRAQAAENVLLVLSREINRLSQELKRANDRLLAYANEHDVAPTNDVWELQMMREDRDRVRQLYNTLAAQQIKIDVGQSFSTRHVDILEPAIVESKPVRGLAR